MIGKVDPVASSALVVAGVGVFTAAFVGTVALNLTGAAAVAITVILATLVLHLRHGRVRSPSGVLPRALVVACAAFTALGSALLDSPAALALVPIYVVAAVVLMNDRRSDHRAATVCGSLLVLMTFALLVRVLALNPSPIDVGVFLHESVDALLHGSNPYTHRYTNIYDEATTRRFYGEGVVQDGKTVYGYPYPPAMLLLTVPGYLLGDARLSALIALCLASLVLVLRARTRDGRIAAVLLVCAPGVLSLSIGGWVEPLIVALLALLIAALHSKHLMVAAMLLGLLFVSKQYFVVLLPCLWLLRPYFSRPRLLAALGTALVVNLPFLLWSPSGFWRALVEYQLVQPYRSESISLLVASVEALSWPPPSVYGPLPLVAGFITAVVLAVQMRPGPAPFALSLAIALAVTVLLSKQAFLNYYCLVGGAIFIAAWSVAERATRCDAGMPPAHEEQAAYPDVLVPEARR